MLRVRLACRVGYLDWPSVIHLGWVAAVMERGLFSCRWSSHQLSTEVIEHVKVCPERRVLPPTSPADSQRVMCVPSKERLAVPKLHLTNHQ